MQPITLRAFDDLHEKMVYSTDDDTKFVLEGGKWSVEYIEERNIVKDGIEMDVPVRRTIENAEVIMNQEPIKVYLGGCEYSLTIIEAMVLRNDLARQINECQEQAVQNLNQKANISQPEVKTNQ